MEINAVAEAVIPALRPFIPLLFRIGEATVDRGVDEVANKIDAEAWPLAKSLWARIRHRVADDPQLDQATAQAAADPTDSGAQETLRQQLERVLATDSTLLDELTRLLTTGTRAQQINTAQEINIGVQGSVYGGTVTATGKQVDRDS